MTISISARTGQRLATAACALALAACGGEDTGSAGEAGNRVTLQQRAQDASLKFARCMRENGVDMPDPKQTANGMTLIEPPANGDPATLQRAREACAKYLSAGLPAPSAEEKQAAGESALKFARCMREQGIDMPDPSGEGIAIGPDSGLNPQDPAFQRAQKACQKHLQGGTF